MSNLGIKLSLAVSPSWINALLTPIVKSKKAGKAYININHKDFSSTYILYIHKNMVITDNNFFGKSTASEVIPISLSIILIYLLFSLIKEYKYHTKENLYQYGNIEDNNDGQ